jgi:hypothetical protein
MTVFKLKTLTILLGVAILANVRPGHAQQVGMIGDWRDAVKLLDSNSDEESSRAEQLLRLELGKATTPVDAAIGLGLFCAKRGDSAAVEKVLNGIKLKFPQPSPHAVAAVLRLQTWSSFAGKFDAVQRNDRLKSMIDAFSKSTSSDSQVLTAFFGGSTFGMIDNELGKDMVDPVQLHAWKQVFSSHGDSGIRAAFTQGYETTRSKVSRVLARYEELKGLGLDQAKENHARAEGELEANQVALTADREAVVLLEKSNDTKIKELTAERKRTEANIAKLNRDWKIPTPGHPGVEKPPPIVPNRLDIYVDPYMTYVEWVTDKNGNRIPQQRTVQKNYSQIEAERDERYRAILAEYRVIRADYDQYINRYRREISTWTKNDAERRAKLQSGKAEAEDALHAIRKESERLRDESEEASKLLSNRSAELRRRQTEFSLDQLILPVLESGKVEELVAPQQFELFHYAREKKQLLDAH